MNFLVRMPPAQLDCFLDDPGNVFSIESAAEDPEHPDVAEIDLGKSSYATANAFADSAVGEAVALAHELPESFYESLEEARREMAEDMHLSYSTPADVATLADRLDRVRVGDVLTARADRDELAWHMAWFGSVRAFVREAADRGQAMVAYRV